MFATYGKTYTLKECGIHDYDSARMAILREYGTCCFTIIAIRLNEVDFKMK